MSNPHTSNTSQLMERASRGWRLYCERDALLSFCLGAGVGVSASCHVIRGGEYIPMAVVAALDWHPQGGSTAESSCLFFLAA